MLHAAVRFRARFRAVRTAAAVTAAVVLAATPAFPAPPDTTRGPGGGSDYRLGPPAGVLSVRAGFSTARGQSDVFDFATQHFTLGRSAFHAPLVGADVRVHLSRGVDAVLSASYARSSSHSEYREWVDNEGEAIEQVTRLTRVPVTASVLAYLTDRGEGVGRLAWIPSRTVLYAGAGGGLLWHRFEQEGSFVDFETHEVFDTRIVGSDGTTWTAHAFAGGDLSLTPSLGLTGEARYTYGRARMDGYIFRDFDRIDLSGLQLTVGLFVRY
jgi:hypothetical protein